MSKYIYQKFLLQCDYETVDMDKIPKYEKRLDCVFPLGQEYNLFDVGSTFSRKISTAEMDSQIDTIEDWEEFVNSIKYLDELIIYNDCAISQNAVIAGYRLATLKAYILRIQSDCEKVKLYYNVV